MELLTCAVTLSTPAIVAYSGIHLLIVTEVHTHTHTRAHTLEAVLVCMQTCRHAEIFSLHLSSAMFNRPTLFGEEIHKVHKIFPLNLKFPPKQTSR